MNLEKFKTILQKAMFAIVEAEERKNECLQMAFDKYYDVAAPFVFPGQFEISRLMSPGFKLYVQQVLDMVYAIDETTEIRNKSFSPQKAVLDNVLYLNQFKSHPQGFKPKCHSS